MVCCLHWGKVMPKPKIAWFSPLPGSGRSLVSVHFTEAMVPRLSDDFEIDLYSSQAGEWLGRRVDSSLAAAPLEAEYDLFVYQIEDGPECHFARSHASLVPGAVIFHDFLLSDPGPDPLRASPWRKSLEKFLDRKLPWPARRSGSGVVTPYALREGAFALFPIFSSERNLSEWRRTTAASVRDALPAAASSDGFYIPMPVDAPIAPAALSGGSGFKIAFCGKPWIEYHAHKLLEAISGRADIETVWLIDKGEEQAAVDLLSEFEVSNAVLVIGRSPGRWAEIVSGSRFAVHSQFSFYSQPGPYIQISMAHGVPCAALDFGASEYLPEDLVFKVSPGDTEAAQLSSIIELLQSGNSAGLSDRMRKFIAERHDSSVVAASLSRILSQAIPVSREFRSLWTAFQAEARTSLLREVFKGKAAEQVLFDPSDAGGAQDRLLAAALDDLGWRAA